MKNDLIRLSIQYLNAKKQLLIAVNFSSDGFRKAMAEYEEARRNWEDLVEKLIEEVK